MIGVATLEERRLAGIADADVKASTGSFKMSFNVLKVAGIPI